MNALSRNSCFLVCAGLALIVALAALAVGAQAVVYPAPGPATTGGALEDDEWIYRAASTTYDFEMLGPGNGTQRTIPTGGYGAQAVPLSRTSDLSYFDFYFYGEDPEPAAPVPFSEVYIHGNGFITFDRFGPLRGSDPMDSPGNLDGTASGGLGGGGPADMPRTVIAPFWMDFAITECNGAIYTDTSGPEGARIFTVQWTDLVAWNQVGQCGGGGPPPYRHTFQVRLHEGSNNIEFQYMFAVSEYNGPNIGQPATAGIAHKEAETSAGRMPLNLQWATGTGSQTRFVYQATMFFPNHRPEPSPVFFNTVEDVPGGMAFFLAGRDKDNDLIDAYEFRRNASSPPADWVQVPRTGGLASLPLEIGEVQCPTGPPGCRYYPYPHAFGVETFQYRLRDNISAPLLSPPYVPGNWGPWTNATINVTAVNDPPSFSFVPLDPGTEFDQGEQFRTVAGYVTNVRLGPEPPAGSSFYWKPEYEESWYNDTGVPQGQKILDWQTYNDAPTKFITAPDVQNDLYPGIDSALFFKPKPLAYGDISLSLRLRDDGGTALGGVDVSDSVFDTLKIIQFVNDPPINALNVPQSVDQGDSVLIGTGSLAFIDDHSEARNITLALVEAPIRGALWRGGAALSVGETFTQQDIDDGLVEYQSDGLTAGAEVLKINATDEHGAKLIETVGGQDREYIEYDLTVLAQENPPPVALRASGIQLQVGKSEVIDQATLAYQDGLGSGAPDIIFTVVSAPTDGVLLLDGQQVTTFSQWDLDNGGLLYVHDGVSPPRLDKFTFYVTDLEGAQSSARDYRITILPLNDAPKPLVPGDQTVGISDPVVFLARAIDAEGDAFTCHLVGEAPLRAALDPDTCQFLWTPDRSEVGVWQLTIEFREKGSARTSQVTFTVEVLPITDYALRFGDADKDGIPDAVDNCPGTPNNDQLDLDGNGIGSACEEEPLPTGGRPLRDLRNMDVHAAWGDKDADGVHDSTDNCLEVANHRQEDLDLDGVGDACDTDMDGDDVLDDKDNCPFVFNPDQVDADGDNVGALCDPDDVPPSTDDDDDGDDGGPGPQGGAGGSATDSRMIFVGLGIVGALVLIGAVVMAVLILRSR